MATTKKTNKKNTRKRGRRYMKKAARRTIAALLMITALIIAAIPATPGHAGDAPIIGGNITYYYNGVNMYFNQITNPDHTDELILTKIRPASYDSETGVVTEREFEPDEAVMFTIPESITLKSTASSIDDPGESTYKCTVISNALDGKDHIGTLTARTVESIEDGAFQSCTKLTEVTAGNCTYVGGNAFYGCSEMTNCSLSNNVDTIGANAFRDCEKLSNFAMPQSVVTLGSYAFANTGLEGTQAAPIMVPGKPDNAATTLNSNLFDGCTKLNAISFADNITQIGASDFQGCENLHYLTLPKSLSSIGSSAFTGCKGLEEITIPGTVADSIMYSGIFNDAEALHFIALDNDTSVSDKTNIKFDIGVTNYFQIPYGGNDQFYLSGYRYDPRSGSGIYTSAYNYCLKHKVRYLYKDGSSSGVVDKYLVVRDNGDGTGELIDVYDEAFNDLGTNAEFTLPDEVLGKNGKIKITSIGTDALKGGSGKVKILNLGNNVTNISKNAGTINGLQKVNISSNSISIDKEAFPSASTGLVIGGNLVSESDPLSFAMDNGYDFEGPSISNPVTTLTVSSPNACLYKIGGQTESSSINYPDIHLPSGVKYITPSLLKQNTTLQNFEADGLVELADRHFFDCDSLESVKLPGTLQYYKGLPFRDCDNLHKIEFKDNNPYFGFNEDYALVYGNSEAGSELSENDKCIYEALEDAGKQYAFYPDSSFSGMKPYAFSYNKSIIELNTTDSNIEDIPEGAFYQAKELTNIYLGKITWSVGDRAFELDKDIVKAPNFSTENPSISYSSGEPWFLKSSKKYQVRGTVDKPTTTAEIKKARQDDKTYDQCYKNPDYLEYVGKIPSSENASLLIKSTNPNDEIHYKDNLDVETMGGYIVVDKDTGVELNLGTDYTVRPKQTIDPSIKTQTMELIAEGVKGTKYQYSSDSKVFTVINDNASGGGSDEWCRIIMYNNGSLSYNQAGITLSPKTSVSEFAKDGDFLVLDKNGDPLIWPQDYDYSTDIKPVKKPGNYTLIVKNSKDSTKTKNYSFSVSSEDPSEGYKVGYVNGQTRDYTGKEISWVASPNDTSGDFYVTKDGVILDPTNKKDYSWSWDNNAKPTEPGTYGFTVYDKSDPPKAVATGSATINGEGGKVSLSSCNIVYTNGTEREYTGDVIPWTSQSSSDFYVEDGKGNTLVLDTDYTMDPLPEVKEVKHYAFTIHGKGNYTGSKTGGFDVVKGSVNPKASTISVNLILNGPDRSAVSPETYKSTNNFQYWNEGDPGIKSVIDKFGNTLKEGTDYVVQGYGTVKPGIGKNTGYITLQFKGKYADEGRQSFFYDVKKDLSKNTSDDGTKSVTIQVTEATIDSSDKIEATITLTDSTTGTDLVKDTDYLQGSYVKTSGHHADVKITGKGDKYVGTYTYNFHMDEKKSSSSSSKSSSSSSKSSSASSSAKSSSSSGTGSSSGNSGSGNKNSGTTVVNRNYYGPNGGTRDELEDMLRAAHIDSINGGTADGYQVNITKSDAAEASFREALIRRYGSLDNIRYFSMDIDVKDENGNDIDTTGMSVTLTLPLPRSMEQFGTNNKVATVDSNGDLEDLNEQFSTLEGRPCVTFVAPHFSPYGFYVNTADLAVGTLDNTPKTGDPIHPKWFLSFGLAALSIFLFLKRDPKSQVKPA